MGLLYLLWNTHKTTDTVEPDIRVTSQPLSYTHIYFIFSILEGLESSILFPQRWHIQCCWCIVSLQTPQGSDILCLQVTHNVLYGLSNSHRYFSDCEVACLAMAMSRSVSPLSVISLAQEIRYFLQGCHMCYL